MTLQSVIVLALMLLRVIINAQADPEQAAGFHITDVDWDVFTEHRKPQAFHAQKKIFLSLPWYDLLPRGNIPADVWDSYS